jgi:hypothetical protein
MLTPDFISSHFSICQSIVILTSENHVSELNISTPNK